MEICGFSMRSRIAVQSIIPILERIRKQQPHQTKGKTMSNETKTKTCSRCKGKGSVTSSVVYSGTPGGCFKCNGNGVLRWETANEINDRREQDKPRAFAVIEEQANELKAEHAAYIKRFQRTSKQVEGRNQQLERELAKLRTRWQDVKNQPPVTRGRWVTL